MRLPHALSTIGLVLCLAVTAFADVDCPPVNLGDPAARRQQYECLQRQTEEQRKRQAEDLQYESDVSYIQGDSCDAIDRLYAAELKGPARLRRQYEDEIGRRRVRGRKGAANRLAADIVGARDRFTADYFATQAKPSDEELQSSIATLNGEADASACYDDESDGGASLVQNAHNAVADFASNAGALFVAEKQCRATPACMGARIAVLICDELGQRRALVQQIATEKANPSGVVNLATLHDLGTSIQSLDAMLADARAAYVKWVHKPLNERACK